MVRTRIHDAVIVIGYCTACNAPVQAYSADAAAMYKTCHHEAPIAWIQQPNAAKCRQEESK